MTGGFVGVCRHRRLQHYCQLCTAN